MHLDTEFLRQHYAAMPDEELGEIDRNDLVEAARQIYDEEVASRAEQESEAGEIEDNSVEPGEEVEIAVEEDWLEHAAEAYSVSVRQGSTDPSEGTVDARDAIEGAGIPCHMELVDDGDSEYPFRWRVLVPGKLIHRATSVLDRDLFNQQFEDSWRTHLQSLDDHDLALMEPRYAFCGLYDRIARLNRAYDEEMKRRQMEQ